MVVLAYPHVLSSADFNGDGKLDLVTGDAGDFAQGGQRSVTVCLGNGNGTFKGPVSCPLVDGYPGSLAVADFNLDGRPDVAVAGSSHLRVLLNDGNWATKTWIGPASGGNWALFVFLVPEQIRAGRAQRKGLVLAMAYPDDLLEQALHLATREKRKPKQASLRRAVSTAERMSASARATSPRRYSTYARR